MRLLSEEGLYPGYRFVTEQDRKNKKVKVEVIDMAGFAMNLATSAICEAFFISLEFSGDSQQLLELLENMYRCRLKLVLEKRTKRVYEVLAAKPPKSRRNSFAPRLKLSLG